MVIRSDPERTAQRLAALDTYARRAVLEARTLRCAHADACRRSHRGVLFEGQLHHVGDQYDLLVDEAPFRIVVVGQEYGHGPGGVSLAARHAMIRSSGQDRRFVADANHPARNPHMRGTTSLLRLLLGGDLGADYEGEFVTIAGVPAHVFECFALVNFLLCSAVAALDPAAFRGGQRGRSTRAMREGCAQHVRTALAVLEPTVLVAQGRAVRRWLGPVLDEAEPAHRTLPLERVRIGETRALLASFVHPSAPTRENWGANAKQPYLLDTVAPAIAALRLVRTTETT